MKKPWARGLAAVLAAALLAGCASGGNEGGQSAGNQAADGQVVSAAQEGRRTKATVALASAVNVFAPYSKWNPYLGIQYAGVYERLAEREQFGSDSFQGVLMKSWEKVDDVTYDCVLYDYIVDSDGNPFTAEDVKFSVDKAHENGIADSKYIESIEVTEPYAFTMKLTDSGVGIFEMVCETCWMAARAAFEKSEADGSICAGTGPYVCVEFISGSSTQVEKRDDYWQTPELTAVTSRANVDVIVYNTVSETTQMAISTEDPAGTQICAWLNESIVEDARTIPGVTVESKESIQMKTIVFNASEYSACSSEALRKAICYATDNDALITGALSGIGYAPPTFGSPYAIGYNKAWESGDYYNYDIEKAKAMLAEAGIPEGTVLKFYGPAGAETEKTGSVLASCLAAIGLKLEVNAVEAATQSTYLNDLASGWDIFIAATTLKGPYLIQSYSYYCSSVGLNNQVNGAMWGVRDDDFENLVDKSNSKDGAQADLDAIHDYVVDNCYVYQWFSNYFTCSYVDAIKETVTNFKNNLVVGACEFSADYAYYE
jgi:ABC-type transport system substrate-binding protein